MWDDTTYHHHIGFELHKSAARFVSHLNLSSSMMLSPLKQIPALGALPDLASISANKESAYRDWNSHDRPDSGKAQAYADSEEDKCDRNA